MKDLNHKLPEQDRELAERLGATLDRAARQPDASLDAALAAARARALAPRRRPATPWLWASGMALAAGLAMVFVLPGGDRPPVSTPHAAPALSRPATLPPAMDDPEMLDNLDMLQALSGGPASGRS